MSEPRAADGDAPASPTADQAAAVPGNAPRRQDRGRRRMAQIVQAGAEVFAERGYERTTTNAIAERAGVSPGSLYQFFSDKDAIVHALAERYASELAAAHARAFGGTAPGATPFDAEGGGAPPPGRLEDVVSAVLDPLLEFNLANPGFKVLFARTDMPAGLAEAVGPVHDATQDRVQRLVGALAPALSDAEAQRAATVLIQLVRAMTPLIVAAEGAERERLIADLHGVLVRYLREFVPE